MRRNTLHFEEDHTTILDVVRINDPAYPRPLLIGSTLRDRRLTTAESEQATAIATWPGGNELLCGPGSNNGRDGDAASVDQARAGAADRVQPCWSGGVQFESDGGGVRPCSR